MKKILLLSVIIVTVLSVDAQRRLPEQQDTIPGQTFYVKVKGAGGLKSTSYVVRETPAGVVDGTNTTFTLANTPLPDKESVYVNGLLQDDAEDYTITGKVITFSRAPRAGNKVVVTYLK